MLLLMNFIVWLAISLRGQPGVMEASNSLIQQTGENIVGQQKQARRLSVLTLVSGRI